MAGVLGGLDVPLETLIIAGLGLLLGLVAGLLLGRIGRHRLRGRLGQAEGQVALLIAERDALTRSATQSGSLADLLTPMRESVETLRLLTEQANTSRATAEEGLRAQLAVIEQGYEGLTSATRQLREAMARGQTRGQWGEMQLEQLLSHAGLLEGTHYHRQATHAAGEGRIRPDIIIDLPGGGIVPVDAKFPFDAYWAAITNEDPVQRTDLMARHARDVLARTREVTDRGYRELPGTVDFVVVFLPLESLLAAAMEADPLLLEKTFSRRVILATPTTMLALLRTIAFGFQRQRMADHAEQIQRAGADMLSRLATMTGHIERLRSGLERAVGGYNDFIGSLESRVLVHARNMSALGVASTLGESPASVDQPLRRGPGAPVDPLPADPPVDPLPADPPVDPLPPDPPGDPLPPDPPGDPLPPDPPGDPLPPDPPGDPLPPDPPVASEE
ncbi:MAG: DNA recombination protein RmuC [Actinomycetales bacterium]|nr:DNA recombination protein RmuC [Actinomycetales bacterium]